jgi:hypothetical protein
MFSMLTRLFRSAQGYANMAFCLDNGHHMNPLLIDEGE